MSNPNIQELITLPDDGQESMEHDESVVPSSPRAATASSRRFDSSTIYIRMIAKEKGGGKISVWESNQSINGPPQRLEDDKLLKEAIGGILTYFEQNEDTYLAQDDNTKETVQTMVTAYNTEKKKSKQALGVVPDTFDVSRQAAFSKVDPRILRICRIASRMAAQSSSRATNTAPPPSV